MKLASELKPGDMIDLEHDKFADLECYMCKWEECKHPEFHSEYEVVFEMEQETSECIRVDFESGFSCGFPTSHKFYTSEG